jgi:hypothetical protein
MVALQLCYTIVLRHFYEKEDVYNKFTDRVDRMLKKANSMKGPCNP